MATNDSTMPMPKELKAWLDAAVEHGLVVSDRKGTEFSPRVLAVVEALHEVLAGGEVTIAVRMPGNTHRKQLLSEKMSAVMAAASERPADGREYMP